MKINSRKIVQINNLSVSYAKNLKPTLKNLKLEINQGDHLAVIGSSGCGKSTFAKSIVQMLPKGSTCEGELLIAGNDLRKMNDQELKEFRRSVFGFIYQDSIRKLNPLMTVGDHLFELLKIHWKDKSDHFLNKNVEEIFVKVGISPERLNSFPHEFSGGMRQRVCIALAFALNPKIIIADEPTTSLDPYTSYAIMKELISLCDQFSSTLILISHDINLAAKWCKKIAVIDNGVISEQSLIKEFIEFPKSDIGRKIIQSSTLQFKNHFTKDISSEVVMEVGNLRYWYRLDSSFIKPRWNKVLNEISFKLFKNETLGIVGISGSGKSTLGRVLSGLLKFRGGFIKTGRENFLNKRDRRINNSKNIQMIFQDPYSSLNPKMTIKESLQDILDIHNKFNRSDIKDELTNILHTLDLSSEDKFLNKYPNQLSGGQLQRVSIARVLLIKPKILICDESLTMLDAPIKIEILQLLIKIQKEINLSIIFITHDLMMAKKFCNRLLVINKGKIVEQGNTCEVFKFPKNSVTKKLIKSSFNL